MSNLPSGYSDADLELTIYDSYASIENLSDDLEALAATMQNTYKIKSVPTKLAVEYYVQELELILEKIKNSEIQL